VRHFGSPVPVYRCGDYYSKGDFSVLDKYYLLVFLSLFSVIWALETDRFLESFADDKPSAKASDITYGNGVA